MLQVVFWALVATLMWTYAGYPAFMLVRAALSRQMASPVPRAPPMPRVSVVMAVRDESENIVPRLENLVGQHYPAELIEILLVCNGCTDDTEFKARQCSRDDPRIRVFTAGAKGGKASAINLAVSYTSGDIIIFADARQRFESNAVSNLVAGFADHRVGAVTGRLEIAKSSRPAIAGMARYWQVETWLRIAESRTGSVVGATGAIYGIRRMLFQALPENLILDDVLIPMQIAFRGLRVVMRADAVAYDEPAPSHKVEFRRRLRTMVGNIQLIRVMPALLSPRSNPLFLRFVSHKVLRVVAPVLIVGTLTIGFLQAGTIYLGVAVALLSLLVLGGVGLLLPGSALAVPSAFFLVTAAALAALFRPHQDAADVWIK